MKRSRAKGRRENGTFIALPHSVIRSQEFGSLDGWAIKCLLDLLASYNGKNNGDLSLTWKTAKLRGWKSPGTLHAAKRDLVNRGFLRIARQGGVNRCTLYAVTFFAIDECKGKLEIAPTHAPPADWRAAQ